MPPLLPWYVLLLCCTVPDFFVRGFIEHPDLICDVGDFDCEDANSVPYMHRNMSGRRCFCDTECKYYGDCCEPTETPLRDETLMCVKIPLHVNPYVGVYAKSFCIDGSYCETSDGDPLTQLPIFSRKTRSGYRNFFCAMCNGEDIRDLEFGNVTFTCLPEVYKLSEEAKEDILNAFSGNKTNSKIHQYCDLQYFLPESAASSKTCFFTVEICPPGFDPDVNKRCKSYMGTIFGREILYKNVYCAECNGVNVSTLSPMDCISPLFDIDFEQRGIFREMNSFVNNTRTGYSMTVLLDLNLDEGNVVGTQRKCPDDGYVFDPWFNQCRQVICPKGYLFQDGSCRPRRSLDSGTTINVTRMGTDQLHDIPLVNISCPRIEFRANQYVQLGSLIYVNSSGKFYNLSDVIFNGSIAEVCLTVEYQEFESSFSESEIILSIVCFALSLCCLTFHFSVYILTGKYKLVPDLNMLSISAAIFFVHIFFLLAPIAQRFQEETVRGFCAASGVLLHYFTLCSFTWSSVIAYDVTKSVLSLQHPSFSTISYSNYIRYSLFAWITPAVPIIIGLTLDEMIPDSDYSPVYGKYLCWVGRRKSLLVFFGVPVAISVAGNLVFYIITATVLYKSNRKRAAMKTSQNTSSFQTQFRLYLKLAMIMGVAWIAGFLAIVWQPLRYVSIIANGLQGLYIFVAFSCKKSVFKSLRSTRGSMLERLHSMGSKKSGSSNLSSGSGGVKIPAVKSVSQETMLTTRTLSNKQDAEPVPGQVFVNNVYDKSQC